MRAYERDDVKIPKLFAWMSAKQLRKLSNMMYKFSKHVPRKRRYINSKTKFYL